VVTCLVHCLSPPSAPQLPCFVPVDRSQDASALPVWIPHRVPVRFLFLTAIVLYTDSLSSTGKHRTDHPKAQRTIYLDFCRIIGVLFCSMFVLQSDMPAHICFTVLGQHTLFAQTREAPTWNIDVLPHLKLAVSVTSHLSHLKYSL
jgi:hypothetical protein